MLEPSSLQDYDHELLKSFDEQIGNKVPHFDPGSSSIANPTPLVDITDSLVDCCRTELQLGISGEGVRVFGKLDSQIYGGSVKVRPAVRIIRQAILSGKLRRGQIVFEATSGNFGLALGQLRKLGIEVIVLVSRKLQQGVLEELKLSGVKTIDLDVDICPAPGIKLDQNLLVAKTVAVNVRRDLSKFGLDVDKFDKSRGDIESLLAAQDV